MTANIPDGSFETGTGWTFTGTAGIESGSHQIALNHVSPSDGTHLAYLQAWTGDGVTAGSITQTVTVDPANAGYYGLSAAMNGGEDGGADPDPTYGHVFVDVYLDGVLWQADVVVPLGVGAGWYVFELAAVYWASGDHTLHIAAHSPHQDILGSDYSSTFRQIVLLDNLALFSAASGTILPGTRGPRLRFAHTSGRAKWETDGETIEEWAGDIKQVAWPLPVLTAAPTTFVGQDPATNRPAYCPAPDQPASGSTPTPPTTGSTCVLARCGAAVAMETHLDGLYKHWQYFINTGLTLVTTISVAVLLNWLLGVLTAMALAESSLGWLLTVFNKTKGLLAAVPSLSAMASVLPDFDATTIDNIRRVFFAALQCDAVETTVSVSAADMQNIAGYMRANPSSFLGDIVTEIVAGCVEFSALGDWQAVIQGSDDSHLCDGY